MKNLAQRRRDAENGLISVDPAATFLPLKSPPPDFSEWRCWMIRRIQLSFLIPACLSQRPLRLCGGKEEKP